MKDTIRLSQRNKDRLSFFDDDGNKAIEKALDERDALTVELTTMKQFKPLLQKATEIVATSSSMPSFQSASSYVPSTSSNVANTVSWSTFDTHVEAAVTKAIEKVQRGY